MSAPRLWWSSSDGRLEMQMTLEQARSASHRGQCDADVLALSRVPEIAAQLAAFDPALVRKDLKGYFAWNDADLADHEQNLQRLLWLAAGDISEEARNVSVCELPQSSGATLYGARVGGYVVANGFTTEQEAWDAALEWQSANV